jgi:hypothetical protein
LAFSVGGKQYKPHRLAYQLTMGQIPDGLVIDHLCRNRRCCNPAHMEPVTNGENVHRGNGIYARNGRKTHCAKGHEFTPENTLRRKHGRGCRECGRIESRRRYWETKAAWCPGHLAA